MSRTYSDCSNLILGFHGCDLDVCNQVLNGKDDLIESQNNYDWLGHGIYFWQNDPIRAFSFAKEQHARDRIKTPSVLGAVIDLHYCLNLCDQNAIQELQRSYEWLKDRVKSSGREMPNNHKVKKGPDFLIRELDCAVIETLHELNKINNLQQYDSVIGIFEEGNEAYPGAGFREKTHIQICIRNRDCIKGYFLPR